MDFQFWRRDKLTRVSGAYQRHKKSAAYKNSATYKKMLPSARPENENGHIRKPE